MSSPATGGFDPRGKRIARNTLLNFGGQAAQLVAAVLVVPLLVDALGAEEFGAFQLVWVAVSYLALFDLGLGRATTYQVSQAHGRGAHQELPEIIGSAVIVQVLLGAMASACFWVLAPVLVDMLKVQGHLEAAVIAAFRVVAVALPAVMVTASLSGALEAFHRFGIVNAVRVPTGIATLLAPLGVAVLGGTLPEVVAAAVAVRFLTLAAFGYACLTTIPELRSRIRLSTARLRSLLRYGGWLTVSNVLSPLMTYLDRYVVGSLVSLTAVAWYTAPYDAVNQLAILPVAIATTLFPAFSALSAAGNHGEARRLLGRGVWFLAVVLVPVALVLIALARPGLQLWLGSEFAEHGTRPMQILVVGMVLNALARLPYAAVQGAGRPEVTAAIHLIEFPLYAVGLWFAVSSHGITGAAAAWTARTALDAALLFAAARLASPRS
ncbi:MAG TPA: flippase [Gemmatimonadales bacterium]|nr:flippase [Gemmatimonadales bacterium]